MVGDQADADLVLQPRVQLVAALGAGWGLDGVANLLRALQLHRVGPAVALVHDVTQAIEGFLIARRRDVQAAARAQLQTRRAKVKLNPVFVIMSEPKHAILRQVQPREGLHLVRDDVADRTRAHAFAVAKELDQQR